MRKSALDTDRSWMKQSVPPKEDNVMAPSRASPILDAKPAYASRHIWQSWHGLGGCQGATLIANVGAGC